METFAYSLNQYCYRIEFDENIILVRPENPENRYVPVNSILTV